MRTCQGQSGGRRVYPRELLLLLLLPSLRYRSLIEPLKLAQQRRLLHSLFLSVLELNRREGEIYIVCSRRCRSGSDYAGCYTANVALAGYTPSYGSMYRRRFNYECAAEGMLYFEDDGFLPLLTKGREGLRGVKVNLDREVYILS